jgi:uncharacterized membrane protein YfcA
MNLTLAEYVFAMVGSFVAGSINTLAGNGSVITLSILTDLVGLPGNLANGTNRVGVFLQAAGSAAGFHKNRNISLISARPIIILTLAGALAGVYVATRVSSEQFLFVFRYLMLLMLLVILVKPERWIGPSEVKNLTWWIKVPAFLLLGFYGGFIQMGMGIFFLAVLVLLSRYSIMEANAIKTVVIFIYSGVVLFIFAFTGLVEWKTGIIMALGQTVGGYLTAYYAPRIPGINLWAYRLLVVIVIFAILIQFDIIQV